jgi:hypothetical protein
MAAAASQGFRPRDQIDAGRRDDSSCPGSAWERLSCRSVASFRVSTLPRGIVSVPLRGEISFNIDERVPTRSLVSRRAVRITLSELMIRIFLVMSVTGSSLLAADVVLGFFAVGDERDPAAIARRVHVLFSIATVVVLLGIHSIVYTYFVATGKWAKEVAQAYQLPDWIAAQATKNKRRAFHFVMGSMTVIAAAAWLGAAADTRGSFYTFWHLGSAALAVAFNLGSFIVEYAIIVAHVRLLAELKERADRLREARYGQEPVALREPELPASPLA